MPRFAIHPWVGQPTELVPSHYKAKCSDCYSCGWLEYAAHGQVPDQVHKGCLVTNARNEWYKAARVRERGEWSDKMTSHLVLYVYPKKMEGRDRWIVVPCLPFLPYLLPEREFAGVQRFVHLMNGDWAGLRHRARAPSYIYALTPPPMRNELYERFGCRPGASPFLPPGHPAYSDGRWTAGFEVLPPYVVNADDSWRYPYWHGSYAELEADFLPANSTLFVGALARSATEADLRRAFGRCGEVADVKLFEKSGFVYFFARSDAEVALEQLQGVPIRSARVRLSWGKPEEEMVLQAKARAYEKHNPPGKEQEW